MIWNIVLIGTKRFVEANFIGVDGSNKEVILLFVNVIIPEIMYIDDLSVVVLIVEDEKEMLFLFYDNIRKVINSHNEKRVK